MSDYNEGDLIAADKSGTRISGRLEKYSGGVVGIAGAGWTLNSLVGEGFKITVLERVKPPLPTTNGYYLDSAGDAWRLSCGEWEYIGDGKITQPPEFYAPFRRLVPEVTA